LWIFFLIFQKINLNSFRRCFSDNVQYDILDVSKRFYEKLHGNSVKKIPKSKIVQILENSEKIQFLKNKQNYQKNAKKTLWLASSREINMIIYLLITFWHYYAKLMLFIFSIRLIFFRILSCCEVVVFSLYYTFGWECRCSTSLKHLFGEIRVVEGFLFEENHETIKRKRKKSTI